MEVVCKLLKWQWSESGEKQTTKGFVLAVNDVYSSENANINMLQP